MTTPTITRESVLGMNPAGMTPAWFDRALNRAIQEGKVARRIAPGRYLVSSVTAPGLWYLTTLTDCTCPGHRAHSKCCCRALAAFEEAMVRERTADAGTAA